MKKFLLFAFILFCLQFLPAKAQWVTIPDPNFATKLTQLFPSCMNGNLMDTTCSDIVNATSLMVGYLNIANLSGVEYFDNLTNLSCYNNQLTSLPSLPHNLIDLWCYDNQLSNLPNLPVSITNIQCYNNQLTSLPNLPPNLTQLTCNNNQLSALPLLPDSINDLDCSFNLLTYLPPLPPFVMNNLIINDNNISCINNIPMFNLLYNFFPNPITCIPNEPAIPPLGLPLCMENDQVNNPNNCPSNFNISGSVYSDQNGNCMFDATDLGSNNISIRIYDSSNMLVAQTYSINGAYGFSINLPGIYKVKLEGINIPIATTCAQADSQMVNLLSINNFLNNIDFPVTCIQDFDAYVHSVNPLGLVFPGQTHLLKTNIPSNQAWYNLDCDTSNSSGSVTINITGPVTYVAPANSALTPSVNGNTFTYNIIDFSTLTPTSFGLQFQTDTTAQANDQICVHVEINPTPLDADTTNNVYDFCYQAVNSYDPNMKEVYPVNVLPGYDDWFTYTIHFQNTGNAPAFNIRLRDTLDANLDINTFEVRGYSHPAIVSINGNNLTVRFNNIMLPDSTTDYEGSMGYFQYRIKPLPNLPLGTQIENTAYIYFDYNAPIVTNTTQNNFQTVVSTINRNDDTNQLKVFPNPANEILNINLQNNNIENCIITNALGQTVYNSANEINANHKIQLNISNLSAGVYFVKVRSGSGSYTAKFVKTE
jgi:uncharacterized repeat protein (TIGR01451 family)